MFVAEMKSNCSLTSWIPNSQIVHAVSASAEGPYTSKELLFDTFHHNPRLVTTPDQYLLYYIGGPANGTADCSPLPPDVGETLDTRIMVSFLF